MIFVDFCSLSLNFYYVSGLVPLYHTQIDWIYWFLHYPRWKSRWKHENYIVFGWKYHKSLLAPSIDGEDERIPIKKPLNIPILWIWQVDRKYENVKVSNNKHNRQAKAIGKQRVIFGVFMKFPRSFPRKSHNFRCTWLDLFDFFCIIKNWPKFHCFHHLLALFNYKHVFCVICTYQIRWIIVNNNKIYSFFLNFEYFVYR